MLNTHPFCCDPSTFELNKGTPDDEPLKPYQIFTKVEKRRATNRPWPREKVRK